MQVSLVGLLGLTLGMREGVEVILVQADPTLQRIDELVNQGLRELDLLMPSILRDVPDVRRIVAEYGSDGLRIAYVLGRDCLPRVIKRH